MGVCSIIIAVVASSLACLWAWNYWRSFKKIPNIKGRSVVISGCDSGFGRLLAEHLDKMGVEVFAGCLLEASVKSFSGRSNLKAFLLDVSDDSSIARARDFVEKELAGRALWAIVNNAGILGEFLPLEWHTRAHFRRVFEVNVFGAIALTLKLAPLVKKGREGRVVNMASINARVAGDGNAYAVSKFALEGFSDCLSFTMAHFNVSVHTMEPSAFKTDLLDVRRAREDVRRRWGGLEEDVKASYGEEFADKTANFFARVREELASEEWEEVVTAYEHALFSLAPRNRYPINRDARFLFLPLSFLPVPWQIKLLKVLMKFSNLEIPKPREAVN